MIARNGFDDAAVGQRRLTAAGNSKGVRIGPCRVLAVKDVSDTDSALGLRAEPRNGDTRVK
jgi:hypothetical protein